MEVERLEALADRAAPGFAKAALPSWCWPLAHGHLDALAGDQPACF